MTLPDYQSLFLPLLRLAGDGLEHQMKDSITLLAAQENLSASEKTEVYPHSGALVFNARVRWANVYLTQAGLLERVRRGRVRITGRVTCSPD